MEIMQKEMHLSERTNQRQLIRQKIADEKANCLAVERQIEFENQRQTVQMQTSMSQIPHLYKQRSRKFIEKKVQLCGQ
jgi:hypothetical protein